MSHAVLAIESYEERHAQLSADLARAQEAQQRAAFDETAGVGSEAETAAAQAEVDAIRDKISKLESARKHALKVEQEERKKAKASAFEAFSNKAEQSLKKRSKAIKDIEKAAEALRAAIVSHRVATTELSEAARYYVAGHGKGLDALRGFSVVLESDLPMGRILGNLLDVPRFVSRIETGTIPNTPERMESGKAEQIRQHVARLAPGDT